MPFYTIVYMQGDEADEVLGDGNNDVREIIAFLGQWDYGEESEHTPRETPWGTDDRVYEWGGYTLSWNVGLRYVALYREVLPA